mmetsp:Transcript_14317/g.49768  ORF Transcript_14317/g.49768 Transcript_14317/m.49768 type:complete len:204 (-) Transcript_14317:78-689(-)
MAHSLLWRHLDAAQIRTLGDETSPPKTKELIRQFLLSEESEGDPAAAEVEVDFHFYNLAFARDCSFSPAKISVFMSIATEVLAADRADGLRTMAASFETFKEHLMAHSVERSPYSVAIFSVDDVRAIVDYVTNGYYRHFRLYKYVLSPKLQLALEQVAPGGVEKPTAWRPLADALVQDITIAAAEVPAEESEGEGEGDEGDDA